MAEYKDRKRAKNSIKSVFASPIPTDLISIRSKFSQCLVWTRIKLEQKQQQQQQISLAQNKSKPKKCIIQRSRLYNALNLRDKMLDFCVIILALDVKKNKMRKHETQR